MCEQGQTGREPTPQERWDARYAAADRLWSGEPNPTLVAEVAALPPGRALDVACGEGADARWLARRGWRVTGVDVSGVALERARTHEGPDDHARLTWVRADLTADPVPPGPFDLVVIHFLHLPGWRALHRAAAAVVGPGGTLLVVGHHPSDLTTTVPRPTDPSILATPDDLAGLLDDTWTVRTAEARPRAVTDPDGRPATVHDTVLRAQRR